MQNQETEITKVMDIAESRKKKLRAFCAGHGHDRSPRGSHGSSHSSSSSKKSHSSRGRSSYKHGRSGRHGYRGHGPMRSPGHRSGRYGHKSGHDSWRGHKSGGHSVHGYRHGSPRGHSRSHRSPSKSHGHGSPRDHFRGRHSPCGGHGCPRHHYRSHHSPPGSHGHGSPRGHYRSHRSRHSPSGGHGHGPWSRKGDGPGTHVHVHITVDQKPPHMRGKYHPKDEYMYARCHLHDNDPSGTITGTILLRQKPWDESLQVHMNVSGIPGSANGDPDKPRLRGLHVHEFGDFSQGCASFGGHYNPDGVDHAGPHNETRHVGDWNNIEVSPEGVINKYFNVSDVHLIGPKAIIGRGIVLHTGEDDLGLGGTDASRATGNAGGRAACCVISWMKSLADEDW